MIAILAHIRPVDLATGQRIDVRVGSSLSSAALGLGGFPWTPAFAPGGRPSGSIELMSLDFSPGIRVANCDMTIAMSALPELRGRKLQWAGAPIVIYRSAELQWPAVVEFEGFVRRPMHNLNLNTLALSSQVSTRRLTTDLLTETYNGDGNAGGDPDRVGTLRPIGMGWCENIEPVMFDTVRNIAQVDGYGNTLAIPFCGEGRASFGDSVGDYASYAALAAAIDAKEVKPGQWATCVARGMIGLGAPPAGVITVDAQFRYGTPGTMLRYLVADRAKWPADKIADETFDLLDQAVPFPIHYWTGEQVKVQELIERIANDCNGVALVTFQNRFAVTRPFGGRSLGVVERTGTNALDVIGWEVGEPIDPVWQIKMQTARPVRVMQFSELYFVDDIVPRGAFDPLETYRAGDVVWTSDGAQWLYRNDQASDEHDPPLGTDGDEWWKRLKEPTKEQVAQVYRDAAPIDPEVEYTAGDLVRDQGSVWTYVGADPWDGVLMPPTLPTESNAAWVLVRGAPSFDMKASPKTIAIRSDYLNQPVAGQLPTGGRAVFTVGNSDVSAAVDWSVVTSGCTATIDATGTFTITGVTASGYIDVRGVYQSTERVDRVTITMSSSAAPPPSDGGGTAPATANVSSFPAVSTSTYPSAPANTAKIKAGTSAKIDFMLSLSYSAPAPASGTRSIAIAAKMVYRAVGGTSWIDVAPETVGSVSTATGKPDYDSEPGDLYATASVTGLTAGTEYEFGVLLRLSTGNNATYPYGGMQGSS